MTGLASGLDTASLVSQLMAVERIPRGRVERQHAAAQQRQDLLKELQTKLKALKTAATDLNGGALWSPTKTATSSDAARVTARTNGTTISPGVYDVEVTQLAKGATQTWTTQTRPNTSNLTLTNSATNVATTVSITPNSGVDAIVSAINAKADSPVTAENDNGSLKLTSKTTGTSSGFTASGQVLNTQTATTAGLNSAYTVNGVAQSSQSNTAGGGIPGVELDLRALTVAGTPVKVTVGETPTEKADVITKMKAFVEAYNSVVDYARSKVTEKTVPNAATITDAKRGVLFGDPGVTQILNTLRNGLMDPIAGNPALQDEMHEIGVSTGGSVSVISPDKVAGKLVFDEAKFTKAWETNRADVEKLLRGDATTPGFTQRMDALVKPMVDIGGTLDGRITAAGSQLKSFSDSLARIDERLERKEERYKRQFTALETALAKSQSIQTAMAGQLAGLPSFSSNK